MSDYILGCHVKKCATKNNDLFKRFSDMIFPKFLLLYKVLEINLPENKVLELNLPEKFFVLIESV